MDNSRLRIMLHATLNELREALAQYLPEGPYRDFGLWALSGKMPQPEHDVWVQSLGVVQMAMLTVGLFEGIVTNEHDWQCLATLAAPLNLFFVYEAISDDLAIGLGHRANGDSTFELRHKVLYTFNAAMIHYL